MLSYSSELERDDGDVDAALGANGLRLDVRSRVATERRTLDEILPQMESMSEGLPEISDPPASPEDVVRKEG